MAPGAASALACGSLHTRQSSQRQAIWQNVPWVAAHGKPRRRVDLIGAYPMKNAFMTISDGDRHSLNHPCANLRVKLFISPVWLKAVLRVWGWGWGACMRIGGGGNKNIETISG